MVINHEGLQLPSLTLCPGFKKGVFESVVGTRSYPHLLKMRGRNKTMPATEEEIQNWYKATTYNLDEGISNLSFVLRFFLGEIEHFTVQF